MWIVKKFESFNRLGREEIIQLVLDEFTIVEDPNGKCIHSYDYGELAIYIADRLLKK